MSTAVIRTVPLLLLLALACTPKSPNLTPRENILIDVRDWLEYAQEIRVSVLTSVKNLHDQRLISDELFQTFREVGQAVEDAQRAVVLAKKGYILATTEDKLSHLVEMLRTLKDSVFEIERLWATYGGES